MDRSLKQIYTLMLMYCGCLERHEILLNADGWIEEHSIATTDEKHRSYEIKFVIDMTNSYIEVISTEMKSPRVDNYTFHMDYMRRY